MNAIELINVSKHFKVPKGSKRHRMSHDYTTFKTSFINIFSKNNKKRQEEYFQALKDINYAVEKGSVLGIIGLNGSGKSTLLKCIAGIYKPDNGIIQYDGRISALIELGAGFHPEFTGRENIIINGIILGLSKKEIGKRYNSIVKYAELEDYIEDPVRTYSSGMYMRLGFSVAVNVDPDILLIDEILSVGDESFAHKCKEKIDSFKNKEKTIVIVTHDLAAAEKWSDEVMWLDKGEVKLVGQPRRVIDTYRQHVAQIEEKRLQEDHQAIEEELKTCHFNKEVISIDKDLDFFDGEDDSYVPDEEGKKCEQRWGTREIEITAVNLLDNNGQKLHVFECGSSMTISINYKVNKEIHNPVFGMGIYKPDGTCCYGTNTLIEKTEISSLKNRTGSVLCEIKSLDLVEDTYYLDVAVHAEDGYPYDYHSRLYSFAVKSFIKDIGIFRPKHSWVIQ